jgi:DNA adenine methylase
MIPKYQAGPGIPLTGYDTYVEPFFGGGAMMIHVHENNPNITKFILNDINPEIVGIYRAIKSDVQKFLDRMDQLSAIYLPLSKPERKKFYYDLRKEYTTNWSQWTSTDESATLYFLMKTGFNGIWQVNQSSNGRFATPCGLLNHTSHVYEKSNVLEWHTFLQKVDIYCGDWHACVDQIGERAFYFFDPPYRDSFTSYGQTFDDSAQLDLIEYCKIVDEEGHLVFYCNRDAGDNFYTDAQGQLEISYYDVTYTAGRRKKTELGHEAKAAREILLHSHIPGPLNLFVVE